MGKTPYSERDICTKFITPALRKAGWDEISQLREEVSFTKGRIIVRGKLVTRGKAKRADYILYFKPNIPLALIEAKDNLHGVGDGMQQALDYAVTLDIPFVFSSNGDGFVFHDRTGLDEILETNLALDAFPPPAELWARYRAWKGLTPEAEAIVLQDYFDDGGGKAPRYYQVNAVNAAIEAIAILKRIFPVAINRVEATANQDMKVLTPFVEDIERYLQIMFYGMTKFIPSELVKTGTTVQSLKYDEFANQNFPLPPLAEQHRIVAKVDELMALCDRLEAARADREATRDRLAKSSLARLNAPDRNPATFQADARFALDHLGDLTARPDQVKRLGHTILDLAVRGRLVPQDADEEPASELLAQIAAHKARLVKSGELRKADVVADLTGTIPDTPVPQGWRVTNLSSICISITDGDHLPPPKAESGVPFLVIGNVRKQVVDFTGSRFVPLEYYESIDPIRQPVLGDILYTLVGSYGIPIVVRKSHRFCVQRHIGIVRPSKFVDVDFLAYAMASQNVFDQATACATGIAQKTVPLSGLRRIVVPLPPLPEQRRIVAKVDELMALCDQLEGQLLASDRGRDRLLESLLYEALARAA